MIKNKIEPFRIR